MGAFKEETYGALIGRDNQKHFKLFKEECDKWINFFALKGWYVDYLHDTLIDGHEASVNVDLNARSANIILSDEWGSEVCDETIKMAAFHEVCELLLAPLAGCAFDRFNLTRESIEENTHIMIQTLLNTVYKKF